MHTTEGIGRVAIVGVGAVGSTLAYALLQSGAPRDILLWDIDRHRAEGEWMDLQHCLPFSQSVMVSVVDRDEIVHCDAIVVTAGVAQAPGETRLDLVKRNVEVMESFLPQIAQANPDALIIMVTNPVDVMARVGLRLTGMPPERLFGSGTVLDTARFRQLLARHCHVHPRHLHAYVVGEHGDSEVMVWSRAMVGAFHLDEYCASQGIALDADHRRRIEHEVRTAAYQIIERKGATHFAIGLACVRLLEAMAHGRQHSLLTVSRSLRGLYGLQDVCISVPTLLSRQGAVGSAALVLSEGEQAALLRSAEMLDDVYQKLGLG